MNFFANGRGVRRETRGIVRSVVSDIATLECGEIKISSCHYVGQYFVSSGMAKLQTKGGQEAANLKR